MTPKQLTSTEKATLLFLIPFLMGTAIDLYVPSLPAIVEYFHTQQHLVQFTISLYMLGYGVGQFFLGILSDMTGRKPILVSSSLLFVCVSLLSAFSPSIHLLIVYRFLQGIGMAGMGVMCRVIAVDCYENINLVKILTYYSASWALGPVIGPFIGAYLQHFFGWQANFYYFASLGSAVLMLNIIFYKETLLIKETFGIKKVSSNILKGISHAGFLMASLMATIIYSCLIVFNVVGPFLIQDTLHYSVVAYGHIALLLGLGIFIGILLNRLIVKYARPMYIFYFGLSLAILITITSILISYFIAMEILLIVIPIFFIILLCGLIQSNMVAKAVSFLPDIAGTAGALYGFFSACGIFIITSLATLLNTQSQIPLLYFYLALFILTSVILALFLSRVKK